MEFNATFTAVLISFLVFMLLMRSWYFEPIRRMRERREAQIADDRRTAVAYSEEFGKLYQEYEAQLKEARRKAQRTIDEIRQDAKNRAALQVAKARENAAKDLDEKIRELAKQRDEAYQHLAAERSQLTQAILAKVTASAGGKVPAGANS